MISLSRLALAAVAILFGLYHALLGFLFLGEYQNPAFAIVGLIAYLSALQLCLSFRFHCRSLFLRPSERSDREATPPGT